MHHRFPRLLRSLALRRIGCFGAIPLGFSGLALALSSARIGLQTSTAEAVGGLAVWSVVILIVGNRSAEGWLSLQDHADLYMMAVWLLVQASGQALAAAASLIPDRAWPILLVLSPLPPLAIGTIVRRALFSAEEWPSWRGPVTPRRPVEAGAPGAPT